MIFTIRPPVRWPAPISWLGGLAKTTLFFLGASAGTSVVTFSAVAIWTWIGIATSARLWTMVALVGLFAAASEAGIVPWRMPYRSHQVSRSTIVKHHWLGAIPYGFALGTGFWTYVNTALPAFVLLLVVAANSPPLAAWSVVAFAAGRAAPIAAASFFSTISEDGITNWLIKRGDPFARSASAILLTAFSLSILAFRNPIGGLP